jgi:hypothetical protein
MPRIAFIVFAQRIGLSLDEIAAELDKLSADNALSPADWEQPSLAIAARTSSGSSPPRAPLMRPRST